MALTASFVVTPQGRAMPAQAHAISAAQGTCFAALLHNADAVGAGSAGASPKSGSAPAVAAPLAMPAAIHGATPSVDGQPAFAAAAAPAPGTTSVSPEPPPGPAAALSRAAAPSLAAVPSPMAARLTAMHREGLTSARKAEPVGALDSRDVVAPVASAAREVIQQTVPGAPGPAPGRAVQAATDQMVEEASASPAPLAVLAWRIVAAPLPMTPMQPRQVAAAPGHSAGHGTSAAPAVQPDASGRAQAALQPVQTVITPVVPPGVAETVSLSSAVLVTPPVVPAASAEATNLLPVGNVATERLAGGSGVAADADVVAMPGRQATPFAGTDMQAPFGASAAADARTAAAPGHAAPAAAAPAEVLPAEPQMPAQTARPISAQPLAAPPQTTPMRDETGVVPSAGAGTRWVSGIDAATGLPAGSATGAPDRVAAFAGAAGAAKAVQHPSVRAPIAEGQVLATGIVPQTAGSAPTGPAALPMPAAGATGNGAGGATTPTGVPAAISTLPQARTKTAAAPALQSAETDSADTEAAETASALLPAPAATQPAVRPAVAPDGQSVEAPAQARPGSRTAPAAARTATAAPRSTGDLPDGGSGTAADRSPASASAPPAATPAAASAPAGKASAPAVVADAAAPARAGVPADGQRLQPAATPATIKAGDKPAPEAVARALATAPDALTLPDASGAPAMPSAQAADAAAPVASVQAPADARPASPAAQAAAPAAAPATPAAQLAQAVASLHVGADGSSHVTIKLDPAELGQLQIRISRTQDGAASVSVKVERPETLATLQSDLGHLHQALDRAGVPEQRGVSLQLAGSADHTGSQAPGGDGGGMAQGGFQQGARQERQPGGGGAASMEPVQEAAAPVAASPATGRPGASGVNITA